MLNEDGVGRRPTLLQILGKQDKATNSMLYEIVWVGSASLFFKAFQNGRPNWNEEKLRFIAGGVLAVRRR
jgi:hypothetical protein